MGGNDDDRLAAKSLAAGTFAQGELGEARARVEYEHENEQDITGADERGFSRDLRVTITETVDEVDGVSRVRHVGDEAEIHGLLLTQRAVTLRERDAQQQRTKRQLAWAAVVLLLGFAIVFAFAPQTVNAYIGAGVLLIAAGAFGVKSFRIKLKDFELSAGEEDSRSPSAERRPKRK